jgi:predicted phosphodiesterase
MRLAILSDIHGNLPAFESALAHAARQRPDATVFLGDIVIGAPDSVDCWRLARSLGCAILRGNHERYVADYSTPRAAPEWSSESYGPLQQALAQLGALERADIAALPPALRLPHTPGLLFVHASARRDTDSIAAHTDEAELEPMFPGVKETLVVRGHNHLGFSVRWSGGEVLTCGSVGLPLDGHATAQYLLLDQDDSELLGWRVRHQSVEYDVHTTLQRFRTSGYFDEAGPIGRLFAREVATATAQVVPFHRFYARRLEQGPLALGEAVDLFLNQF